MLVVCLLVVSRRVRTKREAATRPPVAQRMNRWRLRRRSSEPKSGMKRERSLQGGEDERMVW
jgi:hypothetical protein